MKNIKIFLILLLVVAFATSLSAQTARELLLKAEIISDPQQCTDIANQAKALAEKENDKVIIASANSQIAICLMNNGKIEEGAKYIDPVAEMAESTGDPLALYHAWDLKGTHYYYKNDYPNSIASFEKALTYSTKISDTYYRRANLLSLAECNFKTSNDSASIDYCKRALAIPDNKRSKVQQSDILAKLANIYDVDLKDPAKAIDFYIQAEAATDQPDQKGTIAQSVATIHRNMGNPNLAIEHLQKTLTSIGTKVSKGVHAQLLYELGNNYQFIEEYSKAIDYLTQADQLNEKPFLKALIANHLGIIYSDLSNSNKAIEYYQNAIKIYEELGAKDYAATVNWNIACCYTVMKQYQKAIDYTLLIIPYYQKTDNKDVLVDCYSKLGANYMWVGKFTESVDWAQKALTLAKELNKPQQVMIALCSLSQADFNMYEQKTLDRLNEGYSIAVELKDTSYINIFENWLGLYYDINKNYPKAISFYSSIVSRSEKERSIVPDELKLEFWASEYANYQNIIDCQINLKDYPGAFNSIEKSSARFLLEKLAHKAGESNITFVDINEWKKTLTSNQEIVCYGNLSQDLTIITADVNAVDGLKVKGDMWVQTVKNKYVIAEATTFEKLRAFKKIQDNQQEKPLMPANQDNQEISNRTRKGFETIINHYRSLLSKPAKTQEEKDAIDFLGRKFYQLLIKPIEGKIADKTELIIIPNDLLAFVPYEALIMADGRYLVEKYDIRYLPSLSVGAEISKRKYPDTRKPILAFGNAAYEGAAVQKASSQSQDEFNLMMKGIDAASKKGQSMKPYYDALGISWANLPGTLAEVDAIAGIVPGSICIKGPEVNEQNIKQMSAKGLLKTYKILHFATHGIVFPEWQDLSAIVLSQGLPTDDGYLRASEIANLKLNADFVNLSACETGLGKIYSGEGVVGLTQSFLLAGANSIAVSLWQVADQSTMEFQKEFYRLVFVEKMPISQAINQVKRTFIKGQYNQPFYWAPFVYYGM